MLKEFEFCGTTFTNGMEGGRLIHPDLPFCWHDPDCVSVTKEGLELSVKIHSATINHWDGLEYHPWLGRGVAYSKRGDFSYGRYVFDAILPTGPNMEPAIWLSGHESWPPEIDILEGFNTNIRMRYICWQGTLFPKYKIETNVHYKDNDIIKNIGGGKASLLSLHKPDKEFNTYTLEWHKNFIRIYYNEYLVREVRDSNILSFFNSTPKMHVIMSVGMNMQNTTPGKVLDSKLIVRRFVYQASEY